MIAPRGRLARWPPRGDVLCFVWQEENSLPPKEPEMSLGGGEESRRRNMTVGRSPYHLTEMDLGSFV